jgi:decaprenyl-phosphate phosphoribosyltransferase
MRSVIKDVLSAIRVRQWTKNLLLLGAPIGAAVHPSAHNLMIFLRGFLVFSLISSAGYVLNDWLDKEKDRTHSKKKFRPFAAQKLNGIHAIIIIAMLILVGLVLSTGLPRFFLTWIGLYTISTLSYSLVFKNIPVIEILIVAFGFLIRCLAGAALYDVYVSQWFLIVAGFGSLFLISAKRLAERKNYSSNETRVVITQYSEQFLATVISVSITITLMSYALWAFEVVGDSAWGKLSILPVLLGVLRYLWHSDSNDAEVPEQAILSDPVIPISGVMTAALLVMAIYI